MTLIPEMLSGFRNNKKDRKVKTDRLQELLSLTSRGAGMLIFFVELLICCLLATQDKEDPLCGPKCLLFICKELGVEANLEELTRLSGFIPGKGTTMLGLHNAATKKGLFAAGLKIGLNDLILKKEPSIAYLWDGHFVVVEKTDFESEVAVGVDFLKNVPINEFRNIYSGFVLLVSNHELSFPGKTREGPDIRFEEYNFNWGVVAQGRKIKHIFRFKNVGTQKLVISKVRSSCGCALVSSSAKEIAPGGKGFLRVIVDPAGRFGPQEYRIYVHSNDPISPLIQLRISGIVEDYVLFAPQSVSFGDIKKGTQVPPRKIILAKPYAENFKVLRTNKTNCFETDLRKTKIRMFEQEFDGYEITVFLRSNLPIGLFEEKLIIYTNDRKTPRVIIPVRATIEGGIRFYPDICFFISTKNTTILKQIVTITAIPGVSFKIKEIKTDLRWVCINLITLEEGKINQLEIVLNEETVPETIKGEITVYTDNAEQPQIKIPVYGYVEGR